MCWGVAAYSGRMGLVIQQGPGTVFYQDSKLLKGEACLAQVPRQLDLLLFADVTYIRKQGLGCPLIQLTGHHALHCLSKA
jgi:hypothetical protein